MCLRRDSLQAATRVALLCALLALAACPTAPTAPDDPALAMLPTEKLLGAAARWGAPLPAYAPPGRPPPMLGLPLHRFGRELVTREPVTLAGSWTLEFVPIVLAPAREGCEIGLDLLSEGKERRLWSGAPRFARGGSGSSRVFERLTESVAVSVDGGPGREGLRFRWTMAGPCEALPHGILRFSLLPEPPPQRPHVLLVCSDAHRFDHALGEPGRALMPRLQELARRSVTYSNAYSNASWTLPSIASTLTGVLPRFHATGRRVETGRLRDWDRNRKLPPGQFFIGWGDEYYVFTAFPEALPSLGERLRAAGYVTAAVVANSFYVASGPLSQGFDVVVDANGFPGSALNRLVLGVLERLDSRRPTFLLVHYMDVHEHLRRSGQGIDPAARTKERLLEDYAAEVRNTDRWLSELLDAWDRRQGLEESFIAFYADHGEHLGEPDRLHERHGDSMDEVLLHVPLVAHYPRSLGVQPGRDERAVSLVDLFPTVLEVAGLAPEDPGLHGHSLLAPRAAGAPPRQLFADFQLTGDDLASVREGSRKLVVNLSRGERVLLESGASATELPETRRQMDEPVQEQRLAEVFEDYRRRGEAWSADLRSHVPIDADALEEQLRAIGYVE